MKLKLPKDVMPVVKVLRRDVKRPSTRGMQARNVKDDTIIRFQNKCCPMGLHYQSKSRTPGYGAEFAHGTCSDTEVEEFFAFWDELTLSEAKEAVDLIWPKKGKA